MLTTPGAPLLIAGASARAAARSARRRGRIPMAIDLFGDVDLARAAVHVARVPIDDWPGAVPALARLLPPAPFVITGGLEAHPDVVRALARDRNHEGSAPDAIERARDPLRVAAACEAAGARAPRFLLSPPPPRSGRWLRKPLAGCGGRGIEEVPERQRRRDAACGVYFQERVDGEPVAGVFETDPGGATRLLGVTRQLVGEPDLGAAPFAWCGSIGPLPLGRAALGAWQRLGEALANVIGLRGIFGVDAIAPAGALAGAAPVVVEVNPRYPASLEVIERHADGDAGADACLGKAVIFARRDAVVPGDFEERLAMVLAPDEDAADVPQAREPIRAGRPIVTVLASGGSIDGARRRLLGLAARVREIVEAPAPLASGAPR